MIMDATAPVKRVTQEHIVANINAFLGPIFAISESTKKAANMAPEIQTNSV
jgi:hypothetical protein